MLLETSAYVFHKNAEWKRRWVVYAGIMHELAPHHSPFITHKGSVENEVWMTPVFLNGLEPLSLWGGTSVSRPLSPRQLWALEAFFISFLLCFIYTFFFCVYVCWWSGLIDSRRMFNVMVRKGVRASALLRYCSLMALISFSFKHQHELEWGYSVVGILLDVSVWILMCGSWLGYHSWGLYPSCPVVEKILDKILFSFRHELAC